MYTMQEKTNAELLSMVLGVSESSINQYQLSDIVQAPRSITGLKKSEQNKVYALSELTNRLIAQGTKTCDTVIGPDSAAEILMPMFRYLTKEHFAILLLDTRNHVLAIPTISIGSLNASIVSPKEVFNEALKYPVAHMILVHNHPSGDPKPSAEDISITKRLIRGGKLLDIEVLDHIIIGDNRYISMKVEGLIK